MPDTHALLSASSAHRWLSCTPSARLERGFPDRETEAAMEGTAAHALAEHKLKKALGMPTVRPISGYDSGEMEECTDDYVSFVMELVARAKAEHGGDPVVLVEQRLDFSEWVPEGFGTGDCVVVSDGTLSVVDLKYGTGVVVEAEENSQMKLYALGALRLFEALYDIREVSMTIFQPRRRNVSTWKEPVSDLLRWADGELKEKAALAYKGEGACKPGSWCVFCRASPRCRARADENLRLAEMEFRKPPLLTDSEVEKVLSRIPTLTKWAGDVAGYALDEALANGKRWKGFKVVEGRSVRRYRDEKAVADAAGKAGFTDVWRRSLIPITEMQRLMGRSRFEEVLGGLVFKPPGKPTLVPVTDKRPEMEPAEAGNEFNEIKEDN